MPGKKEPINHINVAEKVFMVFVNAWKQQMAVKYWQAEEKREGKNFLFLMSM